MFEAKFQTFDDRTERAASAPRVAALRTELARRGLTGFIVPRADRQQNEYVPASEERLSWLTGFSGSAGTAVVLMERAALFVDGRYTLQARDQVDATLFEIVSSVETPPDQWLEKTLTAADRLGYDPWLHTSEGAKKLSKACAAAGATLVVGLAAALVRGGLTLVGGQGANQGYRIVRTVFGRSILLGLELLVAADIIRTVAVQPSLQNVAVLGLIVLIRNRKNVGSPLERAGTYLGSN